MYGLVNRGLEDLIRREHGDAVWNEIVTASGQGVDEFLSMENYPDTLTYALVGTAAKHLDVSAAVLLERFGEHWVRFTGREGYGSLFKAVGNSVEEVLKNLDGLHGRIGHAFPEFRTPTFQCERIDERRLRLTYHSSREGLASMVVGLVRGLGLHFGTPVTVAHVVVRGPDVDHDEFEITMASP